MTTLLNPQQISDKSNNYCISSFQCQGVVLQSESVSLSLRRKVPLSVQRKYRQGFAYKLLKCMRSHKVRKLMLDFERF